MKLSYLTPGVMTSLGEHADVPVTGVAEAARTVQGLLIHEGWAPGYGVTVTDPETVHIRPVSALLDKIRARDDRPLKIARDPAGRTAASCRTFTVLTVALLRASGIPARARCGYGSYFTPGWFESHWVTEYQAEGGWKLADTQLDELQQKTLGIDFDPLDVPREKFLPAIDAWHRVRAGAEDPARFGLPEPKIAGLGFIAGDVIHDRAALENLESLPWDVWHPMPSPEEDVDLALFDRYATGEEPLKIPSEVYNPRRARLEPLPQPKRGPCRL